MASFGVLGYELELTHLNLKEKEEVKKQSMLYLYGDYQEDGTFLAKRVIIDRFEKEGEWE